jgi:hypothetical protein
MRFQPVPGIARQVDRGRAGSATLLLLLAKTEG